MQGWGSDVEGPQTMLRPTQSPQTLCRRLEGGKGEEGGKREVLRDDQLCVWGLLAIHRAGGSDSHHITSWGSLQTCRERELLLLNH